MLLYQFAKASQKFEDGEQFDVKLEDDAEESADDKDGSKGGKKEKKRGGNFADRFYRTLYDLIMRVHLLKVAKMDDYFALMFKAMKSEKDVPRVVAFIRRLLQMSFVNESNFVAATLLVISEIFRVRSDVRLEVFRFTNSKANMDLPKSVLSSVA